METIDPKELIFYEDNAKEHPKEQIDKIKASITEFGFNVPVIVDKDNVLIAGHGRTLAAIQLGLQAIPFIKKDNLSQDQIKAYRIADNKTAESNWIEEALIKEIKYLQENGFDLSLTGFEDDEISKMLKLQEVEDTNILDERYNVIVINPPEAPRLKERLECNFDNIEDYEYVKEFFMENGKFNSKKLRDLI